MKVAKGTERPRLQTDKDPDVRLMAYEGLGTAARARTDSNVTWAAVGGVDDT